MPPSPGVPHPPGGRPPDVRRKAHARLAERFDPARSRHKPLSLLRQDGRRLLEVFLDAECPLLPRAERDRLIEDVLSESVALGPLEELFRDEAVREILVLAAHQVIARKSDVWTPTSVRFRDAEQFRSVLRWYAESGEQLVPGAVGGFDVRLGNGFRVLAVLPPEVMGQPPLALLVRGAVPVAGSESVLAANGRSGVLGLPLRAVAAGSVPGRAPAGVAPTSAPTPTAAPALTRTNLPRVPAAPTPAPAPDPFARFRQRVTERIVLKFAAAGVYDLYHIPLPELRKIVLVAVREFCEAERIALDETARERLALEILAGMNR